MSARQFEVFKWSDDAVALLKRRWSQGASASTIAAEIGNGVSRSAVIGKVHRLKLPSHGTNAPAYQPRTPRAHGNLRQPKANAIAHRAAALQALPPMPAPADDETDVGVDVTQRVGLMDLTLQTCRWPVGFETGSKQMFCGAEKSPHDGPYCRRHAEKAVLR